MFRVYLFSYPESLLHFHRSASLSTRHVVALFSCGLTLRFLCIHIVASRCLWGMTCRAGIGQKHYAPFTLQGEPSRTGPKQTDSDRKRTYVMKWKLSQLTPNRAEPSRNEPIPTEQSRTEPNLAGPSYTYVLRMFRVYLFSYPESLLHFHRSASLSTRHVVALF
jgi:hypothetical protein